MTFTQILKFSLAKNAATTTEVEPSRKRKISFFRDDTLPEELQLAVHNVLHLVLVLTHQHPQQMKGHIYSTSNGNVN
jgi:hypothetical protein